MTRLKDLLWCLLAVLVAVPVIFLQLDIQVQYSPNLARLVPAPFQSRTATFLTERAINDEDWSAANFYAERNLRRRPAISESLSLLALARASGNPGNDRAALEMLAQASGRGWRDPVAQTYAAGMAFSAGKPDIVAARLDALWRMRSVFAENEGLVQGVLADPAVRDAFAKRYDEGVPWAGGFLQWAVVKLPPDQFADLLQRVRAQGGVADCRAMARAVTGMLRSGDPRRAARSIWMSSCGGAAAGAPPLGAGLADNAGAGIDPFRWSYPSESGLRRTYRDGALHYAASDLVRARLARRFMDLDPGEHRLTAEVSGDVPILRLECAADGKLVSKGIERLVEGAATIAIPAKGCGAQVLTLEVARGEGAVGNVSIR